MDTSNVTPEPTPDEEAEAQTPDSNEGVEQPGQDDGKITVERNKWENLQQQVVRLKKEEQRREAERRKAQEKQLEEQGKWQQLAEQREREAEEAKQALRQETQRARVYEVASRYKFHNPQDVAALLGSNVDFEDDSQLEQAVINLKTERPYLVDNSSNRTGGALQAPAVGLSAEKLAAMTPEEIKALPPDEVDAALNQQIAGRR